MTASREGRYEESINELHRRAARCEGVIRLAGGLPALASWQYGWPEGHVALRAWIAARMRARGESVTADDVFITAGAQQALALATAELCSPGTRVAVGETSYASALDLFRLCDAVPIERGPSQVTYVMAGVRNPTGADGAPSVAQALASGRPAIIDEAYAGLRFDGRAPGGMLDRARERVWLEGGFAISRVPLPSRAGAHRPALVPPLLLVGRPRRARPRRAPPCGDVARSRQGS